MSTSVGIHLGNTSASVAVNKNGKVDVVANSHGDRITPAMVTMNPEETLVGFSSKQSSHRFIAETVKHANSLLGKRFGDSGLDELIENFSNCGLKVTDKEGIPVYDLKNGGKSKMYSAKQIITIILKDVLETAQAQTGNEVNEAVFTAPVAFLPAYRDELIDAASNAGFQVLRVISEPAAAALAYSLEDPGKESFRSLVFRVGGISQDVTLLKIVNGMITIEDYIIRMCGGDVLTEDIADHFASMFERQNKTSIKNKNKAMNKLLTQSEKCKHVLSTMPSASCHIDSLYDGVDYNGNLSRSRFEMLISDHLQTLVQPVRTILENNKISSADLKYVIMCGGTSNIPKLQEIVSRILPQSEMLCSIPPAEVIAIGAGIEAGLLVDLESPEIADEDCDLTASPTDIYVQVQNQPAEVFIKSGVFLPTTMDKDFLISLDKEECTIQLKYGQCKEKDDSLVKLSEISLRELSPGKCVNVQLKYFANGHLVFTCTDKESSKSKSLTITSS